MRLIDAESLIQNAEDVLSFDMLARINAERTIDAVPVRHWRWIGLDYDGYSDGNPAYTSHQCSCCGNKVETDIVPNYCDNCGAKMDEVI